ncbi:unnamed protein product [Darwinula stevensoni]|uniref:Fibronectin type-III domain-containing protein n=1 Tax=Darwinula stevensoni TaxID=69355 RepID=A0A7R9A9Q7_9CRUS|nr:unnamed protein product [Darwinula stevensoni]CAG0897418.1 unnamed protein product [Darwinula stevensoni]
MTGTVPCCGSGPTEGQNMTSVGIFKRRSFGGRFFLESPPTEDVFPPNKVIDLRVTPDPENGVFVLAWTAPGGDYNMGRAARYELKYARDRESLNDEKFPSAVLLPTPTPATAGSKEVFRVDIDADGLAYNTLYYFAIRSLHGQYSEISNPVAGFIIRPTTVAPATVPYPTNDPWTTHNTLGLSRTQFIGVVIGCVGFLILVLVFTMFYFLVMSRQKSKFHEDDDSSMAGESGMTQEKSEPDLIRPPTMKARGHVTVINTGELNGGFVAPQFVPASQILEEHERRKSSSSYTNLRSQEAIYANYRPTSKTNGHMVPNGHLPNGYHDRVSVQSGQQSESTASVRSDPTGGQPQGISLVGCRRGSFDDQGHTGTSRSPPVIPPKPYTKGLFFTPSSSLNDSHSSGGSDKKIWTATQV